MASPTTSATRGTAAKVLDQTFNCRCGQVQLSVKSPNPLRLVCYCKDCRGYYNTLHQSSNKDSTSTHHSPWLDPWGGCDYIHLIQPNELHIVKGHEHVKACKIRPTSPIRRVYANCCNTPLFSSGGTNTLLMNSLLIADKTQRPEVTYRIMGRQALSKPTETTDEKRRPHISWSIPFSWLWTMARRMPDKTEPLTFPIETPNEIPVLENFEQG